MVTFFQIFQKVYSHLNSLQIYIAISVFSVLLCHKLLKISFISAYIPFLLYTLLFPLRRHFFFRIQSKYPVPVPTA